MCMVNFPPAPSLRRIVVWLSSFDHFQELWPWTAIANIDAKNEELEAWHVVLFRICLGGTHGRTSYSHDVHEMLAIFNFGPVVEKARRHENKPSSWIIVNHILKLTLYTLLLLKKKSVSECRQDSSSTGPSTRLTYCLFYFRVSSTHWCFWWPYSIIMIRFRIAAFGLRGCSVFPKLDRVKFCYTVSVITNRILSRLGVHLNYLSTNGNSIEAVPWLLFSK